MSMNIFRGNRVDIYKSLYEGEDMILLSGTRTVVFTGTREQCIELYDNINENDCDITQTITNYISGKGVK